MHIGTTLVPALLDKEYRVGTNKLANREERAAVMIEEAR